VEVLNITRLGGYHSDIAEESSLLGCYTLSFG